MHTYLFLFTLLVVVTARARSCSFLGKFPSQKNFACHPHTQVPQLPPGELWHEELRLPCRGDQGCHATATLHHETSTQTPGLGEVTHNCEPGTALSKLHPEMEPGGRDLFLEAASETQGWQSLDPSIWAIPGPGCLTRVSRLHLGHSCL